MKGTIKTLSRFVIAIGNIKAKKRLYMTATPKVYSESSKAKAKESDNAIYSMDDEGVFGEEIYTLNFTKAIALDLLTDYKVMILAVRKENLSGVTNSVNQKISRLEAQGTKLDKKLINNEFESVDLIEKISEKRFE